MIVNLEKFIAEERPRWERLDAMLRKLGDDPWRKLPLTEARELELLYQRAAADLARLRASSIRIRSISANMPSRLALKPALPVAMVDSMTAMLRTFLQN